AVPPSRPASSSLIKVAYNRNALADSVVARKVAVALTKAGTLLRFSLPEVSLTGEYSGGSPITCIGANERVVLAAAADGSVFRVDVAHMKLERSGHVDGTPVWIGPAPAGDPDGAVVVTKTEERRTHHDDGSSAGVDYDATIFTVAGLPGGPAV